MPVNQPYGKVFIRETTLTIASQKQAVAKLMEKSLIFEDDLGFMRILDPALGGFIGSAFNIFVE